MRICSVQDCKKQAPYVVGFCPKHYQRWKIHNDPTVEIPQGTRHGYKNHPLYPIWKGIKARCINPNVKAYHNYGGRGIIVCAEWINDPKAFIEYAENLPGYNERSITSEGTTLDRKDNNGNYEPGNIRWTDRVTQRANQRSF